MYRYRDHHLHTQQAARPWIRWAAVVFGAFVLVYLSTVWVLQGRALPNATAMIGDGSVLPEDVYAVAVLFNDNHKDLVFDLTGLVDRHIAIRTDGTTVPADEMDIVSSRPAGWFWPNTVGAAYVREGDRVVARRIVNAKQGLRVPMPYATPIQVSIHPDAQFGARCEGDCNLPGVEMVSVAPIDVLQVGNETVINSESDQIAALHHLAEESAKLNNPVEQTRRTADGNRIVELVPAQIMEPVPVDGDSNTFQVGGDLYMWFYRQEAGIDTLLTTTSVLLDNYQNELSTKTWTNRICGKKPVSFYKQDIEPTLAERNTNAYTLVRSSRAWHLCLE